MSTLDQAGWAFPGAARKAHFFDHDSVSVCGQWMFLGEVLEPETGRRSKDDCAACVKKLPAASGTEEQTNG